MPKMRHYPGDARVSEHRQRRGRVSYHIQSWKGLPESKTQPNIDQVKPTHGAPILLKLNFMTRGASICTGVFCA